MVSTVLRNLILLFVMYCRVLSWESLYSELKNLGGSCFPQDSCYPVRREEEDHLWNNFTCECGAHCLQHSTCCADSPHINELLEIKLQPEACHKISGMSNTVKSVSKCYSGGYNGYQIQNKCENSKIAMDPIAMVPVTSLVTNQTYKNYFCALCNCDARDIIFWKISLQIKFINSNEDLSNKTQEYVRENLVYQSLEQSWGILDKKNFYPIVIKFQFPPSLQKVVKKCHLNMISQCNASLGHPFALQQKCLSYYAPIKMSRNIRYRNIHCALCNSANMSQFDSNRCKPDVDRRKAKPSFSFALLLDINSSDGDLVGQVKMCDKNQTWDPFFKKCRSLVCALPGHVVKDGKCVKN